jgi:ABC-type Fe3+-siderophore transport system permease subunit
MAGSLLAGRADLGPGAAWRALLNQDSALTDIIIWQIRVPRTLLAALGNAAPRAMPASAQASSIPK